MILDAYSKEIEIMKMARSEKNLIANIVSKLDSDQNIKSFFRSLVSNCSSFDSLEHMQRYYFEKDLDEAYELLRVLVSYMLNSHHLRDVSGREVMRPCHMFPDYIGRSAIYYIGYFPLIEAIYEKRNYNKFLKKQPFASSNPDFVDKVLFNKDSHYYKSFPDDKYFIDTDLHRKKVDFEREHYQESREPILNEAISKMCEILVLDDAVIEAGRQYWDMRMQKKKDRADMFSSIIQALAGALSKDNDS